MKIITFAGKICDINHDHREVFFMKASRFLSVLLILAVLAGSVAALAEDTRYEEVYKAYSINSVDAQVDGHGLFRIYERNGQYGLIDETGAVLIAPQFKNHFSYVDYGYFYVQDDSGELNNQALVDAHGNILTPYQYADFKVLDQNWVLGIKLTPTTSELYDYSGLRGTNYLIYAVDVYDFSRGTQVGSLKREQYKRAKIVAGKYLLTEDRNEKIQVYDENLQPIESNYKSLYDDELYITKVGFEDCVVSRITGETVAKGLSRVYGISRSELYWVKGDNSRSNWGLMDRTGKLLTELDYDSDYSSNNGGYMVVSYYDKKGLMRLSDGQVVVPCKYDEILRNNNTSSYVSNGYAAVVLNGKVGFVDLNGNVTCEPKYAKAAVTVLGCTMYATDLDGTYIVIAADGTVTRDIAAIREYNCSADGYFLSAQNADGLWGVIDWHGESVIPYINKDYFSVKHNNYVIYNETLYRLAR